MQGNDGCSKSNKYAQAEVAYCDRIGVEPRHRVRLEHNVIRAQTIKIALSLLGALKSC